MGGVLPSIQFIFYNCLSCTQGRRVPGPIPPVLGRRWGSRHPGRVAAIHRGGNAARQTTSCSHFHRERVNSLEFFSWHNMHFFQRWKGASVRRELTQHAGGTQCRMPDKDINITESRTYRSKQSQESGGKKKQKKTALHKPDHWRLCLTAPT